MSENNKTTKQHFKNHGNLYNYEKSSELKGELAEYLATLAWYAVREQ